ncbi:substrate-binding periplasmic protein [Marinobacter sp. es.048]|uniref:substrate-binding periplasmic protein n=1 Tax=Marinobacter sp. es.048 TaxID=1761795 RepID=UPI00113049F3|nr:ABC transporter substrate-binding protein [Marinobacter sp. es.048]
MVAVEVAGNLRLLSRKRHDDRLKQAESFPEVALVNRHLLYGFASPLCLGLLVAFLALPRVSMAQSKLTFAFGEESPPYSFSLGDKAGGLFPELVRLTFSSIPGYTMQSAVMPWSRAQYNVRLGLTDGLLTYPSKERQNYAVFSAIPLFNQDYGHLVYSAENPNIGLIESATSFSDLSRLKVIVEKGSKWEEENIPDYLERVPGRDMHTMMHLLMLRKAGDFLVLPAEDARFIARKLGYSEKLEVRNVDFIPNSLIPFHIGVSRELPSAMKVINQVDQALQRPELQSQLNTLIKSYR